jgi:glucose-6-phosphate isomerase
MDFQQLWQRYEEWLYYHDGLGLYLDISRISFDDALVETLKPQFARAFQDMAALEGGVIANPDENRLVGHYWLRNPELAPSKLQKKIVEILAEIADFTRKVNEGTIYLSESPKFTDILSIGIGGSALTPEFVLEGQGKPLTHKVRYLPSRFNFTVLFFS